MARNSHDGLYYIVAGLFLAAAILGLFLMFPDSTGSSDVASVLNIQPSSGED